MSDLQSLNLFIFQIALLFVPGIVWAIFDAKYGAGRRPSFSFFIVYAFIYGIFTYLLLGLLYDLWSRLFFEVEFDIFWFAETGEFGFDTIKDEVLWSMLMSVLFSIIWLKIQSSNYITTFLQNQGISKTIARDEVWTNVFNREETVYRYVRAKDFENQLIYEGWVETYSENDGTRELFIKSALIMDFQGKKIDEVPFLYVSFFKEKIWLEFPRVAEDETNQGN